MKLKKMKAEVSNEFVSELAKSYNGLEQRTILLLSKQ